MAAGKQNAVEIPVFDLLQSSTVFKNCAALFVTTSLFSCQADYYVQMLPLGSWKSVDVSGHQD